MNMVERDIEVERDARLGLPLDEADRCVGISLHDRMQASRLLQHSNATRLGLLNVQARGDISQLVAKFDSSEPVRK